MEHDTGSHPESTEKLLPSVEFIQSLDGDQFPRPTWQPATLEQLQRVHTPAYVQQVRDFAAAGGGLIEADTVVSRRSFDVARLAAGAVCDAVHRVTEGLVRQAFCLLRPPGHHALADQAMGFCLFNNIAVGARVATAELDYQRVLIVDWDVHHGNGTQDIFYAAGDVAFFSIHRDSFYPDTGSAHETGIGAGSGLTKNLPIPFGVPPRDQLAQFEHELNTFADSFRPQLVLISAGFDAHADDPLGSLGLATSDFAILTRVVRQIAERHAHGKIVSVLEGGYNPPVLAACVRQHLLTLVGDSLT